MAASLRSSVPLAVLTVLAVSAAGGAFQPRVARAAARADAARITASANVTLRALPSASAPAVASLPLGTEVTEAGPAGLDKTWVRVKLADGREGWLLASLTRTVDPAWRWATFDRIITDRLGRKGDGFPAVVELVAFIERVSGEYTNPDGQAQVELARLRAMAAAAAKVPPRSSTREPYASWLSARKNDLVFDAPGGRWILAERTIWERHARHAATPTADEIAWFAVTNGLGGECEGYLPCYLDSRNRLQGEYLRRHPAGRRAAEAVSIIKNTVDILAVPAKPHEAYEFDRKRDCQMVMKSIDTLTTAVEGARVTARDAALASLGSLRRICQ
jgi:hypothetical protein